MSECPDDLMQFLDLGWACLTAAQSDPNAAARFPTFATVSPQGVPEARTVVLRQTDRVTGQVEVHTDAASGKVAALRRLPRAQLHFWDSGSCLQVRLTLTVDVLTGKAAAGRWARVPNPSRAAYGKHPPVGTPIPGPCAFEITGQAVDFAVLSCRVDRIDLLELAAQHRRAIFERRDDWQGYWIAP